MKTQLYFDMTGDDYRAADGLSFSSARTMIRNPFEYWARKFGGYETPATKAQDEGLLWEQFIIDPMAALDTWAAPFDPPADAIADDMESLREAGNARGVKGRSKDDLRTAIRAADPGARLVADLEAEYLAGRTALDPAMWAQIKAMIDMRQCTGVDRLFTSGLAQVSAFAELDFGTGPHVWKARPDWLTVIDGKPVIVEIKTYQNSIRKPVEIAINNALQYDRYGMQAMVQLRAVKAAAKAADPAALGDLAAFAERPDDIVLLFLFVERGTFPTMQAIQYAERDRDGNMLRLAERDEIDLGEAVRRLRFYSTEFGSAVPWGFNLRYGVPQFEDEAFSPYYLAPREG